MNKKEKQRILQIGLFATTIVTTTIAGAEWMFGRFLFYGDQTMTWNDFMSGFQFSGPFLLILTVHEFGHYFTARYHQIKVTLPYYIPAWLGFLLMPSFGTMGAFIQIKSLIHSRKEYFDVGVSGPIAGFIVALGVIWYGFTFLPEPSYIFEVHPEYEQYGEDYAEHVYNDDNSLSFKFGDNLIFWWFANYYVDDVSRLPHPNEMIHYPFLLAGYLALFFTALNLLPIGQLDGGHVLFSLFGEKTSRIINKVFYLSFLFYAGLGIVNADLLGDLEWESTLTFVLTVGLYLYFLFVCLSSMFPVPRDRFVAAGAIFIVQFGLSELFGWQGYSGYLIFAFVLGRFIGIYHPKVSDNRPLDTSRKIIGWLAIMIFILCLSPEPFIIE
jgi:membrane-associated protease RseP (regulator of RpoE activity)